LLFEIFPGNDEWDAIGHGHPVDITAFNGQLFFQASSPTLEEELFILSWQCP
jgi:hypothetical protein